MELSADLLEERANQYRDVVDEEAYRTEVELLEGLPEKFAQGTWKWDEIEWVVLDWKLESFPNQFSNFPENDVHDIESAINEAIEADTTREKIEALIENELIEGIGVTVATAILLFMDPTRFTVLDKRAWRALHEFGYLYDPYPSTPRIDDYLLYLGTCRAIAAEYDVSLRDLDRALWLIGGE